MPHPFPFRRALNGLRIAAASLALAGCPSINAPERLDVVIEEVVIRTEEEHRMWPFTPTISGGRQVTVRGTALTDCGTLHGTARLRGSVLTISVEVEAPQQFCLLSTSGWQPFEARVTGLEAGAYRVRASARGHDGRAEFEVSVGDFW